MTGCAHLAANKEHTMEYALHFGLRPERDRTDIRKAIVGGGFFTAIHAEGDSFLEWGEGREHTHETAHAMIYFEADDGAEALKQGERFFNHLLAAFVADPEASTPTGASSTTP
jgi:hypothetical protein